MSRTSSETPVQRHSAPAAIPEWGGVPDPQAPMDIGEWATPIHEQSQIPVALDSPDGHRRMGASPGQLITPELAITAGDHTVAIADGDPEPAATGSWSITHVPSGLAVIRGIKTRPWARACAAELGQLDIPWHLPAEQLQQALGGAEPDTIRALRHHYQQQRMLLGELAQYGDPETKHRLQRTLLDLGCTEYTGPLPTEAPPMLPGPPAEIPVHPLEETLALLETAASEPSQPISEQLQRAEVTDEQQRILTGTNHPAGAELLQELQAEHGHDQYDLDTVATGAQRWNPATDYLADRTGPATVGDPWRPPASQPANAVAAAAEPEPSASAGDEQGAQVAVAGPFYPAREGLANVELAEAAIEAFETYRAVGYDEGSARREAAIAASPPADEHDVTNMRYAGVTVTDAAVERYLEYRAAGADREAAREEAAADTAAEHTRTIEPHQAGRQTPDQPEPATPAATPHPEEAPAVPATEAGAAPEVGPDPWRPEPAQPATTRPAPERVAPPTGGQAHEPAPADDQHRGRAADEYEHAQPDPEPAVEEPAPDQPDGQSVTPVPAPRPATEPAAADQQEEEARLEAAMRRAETALQRADTELAAHQPEPARTEHAADTPPADRARDAEVGEVSL